MFFLRRVLSALRYAVRSVKSHSASKSRTSNRKEGSSLPAKNYVISSVRKTVRSVRKTTLLSATVCFVGEANPCINNGKRERIITSVSLLGTLNVPLRVARERRSMIILMYVFFLNYPHSKEDFISTRARISVISRCLSVHS